ncbi:glycerol-3-phosphate acyltransferase [Arenimonas soli]|uniref:Glycerol-3-phosphate acyltransferase n=1 Tax=Arenimonas soli TaxID=2269504 RepID=A0ABQ1HL03_9GAMM|nr:glycerol-3-phosphate 1-O-acyltransferase PlsB [Arenimonas soli]GGA81906.1 glycerol-3-phosphate acyltransferase [Arenimonas soli]
MNTSVTLRRGIDVVGRLLGPWLELTIEGRANLAADSLTAPVCYVIEDCSLGNLAILERACRESGLPSPRRNLASAEPAGLPSWLALSDLRRIGAKALSIDVALVPVSIFVGRTPMRRHGWFSTLFAEDWALVGRFRRLLAIALNGRDTHVHFSAALPLREFSQTVADVGPERATRKLGRILRTHFRRVRAATIGPDLSTRRLLIDSVLASSAVKAAIADQTARNRGTAEAAHAKARAYAHEIAADYSHAVVRSASLLLAPVLSRIYRGIRVNHLDRLKSVSPGSEIVYVPCHRSTMDDVLVPYLLYANGIAAPHIVAGINLNLPLIGTIMRKGGAFFIRRSIRGNALYSAVLSEYMSQLVSGGFPLAYFIEGGRSRTGRTLAPKTGMIAMTVRGYLRQPRRPVLFQPIYIGYEKILESGSYRDELSGRPKQKESIWHFLRSIPRLLSGGHGQVVLNFGKPIRLDEVLAENAPAWDGSPLPDSAKPRWLPVTVDALAEKITLGINAAADLNPVNLLAIALLSTPKHAMGEIDLLEQLGLSVRLLAALPYSDDVTWTRLTPGQIVAHGEQIGVLERVAHPLGDVLRVGAGNAVELSYYRNNVLHLFTAQAWVACCFQYNHIMSLDRICDLGRRVYPFLRAELFLPWDDAEFGQRLIRTVEAFAAEGLLQRTGDADGGMYVRNAAQSDEVFRLRTIGHPLQQAFERYYIAISVLSANGTGRISAARLEHLCHLTAQRLSLLYTPAAPEFFDRSLFRSFIQKLRGLGVLWTDPDGNLAFDDRIAEWSRDAGTVLSRELRHAIDRLGVLGDDAVATAQCENVGSEAKNHAVPAITASANSTQQTRSPKERR